MAGCQAWNRKVNSRSGPSTSSDGLPLTVLLDTIRMVVVVFTVGGGTGVAVVGLLLLLLLIRRRRPTNHHHNNNNNNYYYRYYHYVDDNYDNDNDNRIQRRNSRFLHSPHSAANRLQHELSRGPGAIVCKSRATYGALITCYMSCKRATRYEGTAQLLTLTEFNSRLLELYFIG